MLSLGRSIYTGVLIGKEYGYKDNANKRHSRQAEVMRRDEYYGSDDEMEVVVGTERD